MNKTQTLEYNKQTGKITLNTYTQDEFLESEMDITEQVTALVLDKLYDEYGLDDGDELLITKQKSPKIRAKEKQEAKAICEALDKKLKEQSQKRTNEFDTIIYGLKDLKQLCETYAYNLVITEDEISVYPTQEEFIAEDVADITNYLDSYGMNNRSKNLETAIDYVYKEILFLKGYPLDK
jgi:hypothetical protein